MFSFFSHIPIGIFFKGPSVLESSPVFPQASFRCLVTEDDVGELWSAGSGWAAAVVKPGKQLFDSHYVQISH